ncbi:hypothetical protein K3N28_03185 [Glycomyces sp. TRM65418]|uniref:hypothetical protein n=1 Tax=Glycomyces sp. TRM65418 TaxID=2867006 RepID=UPI001CE4CBE2|nr:hypothetical protein [Glycomyces sp. TRM65418]MCC3762074.1 hypothetical protein [Glycomyces sp. TRM65418]QZD56144.1 hypothetical protein K3N28_03165 [Glycomyces sp. TRM65418]
MRPLLLALAAIMSAFTLSGCSPVQVGLVGVGVDRSGDPVLAMFSCEGPAETIRVESAPTTDGDEPVEWTEGLWLENPRPRSDDPASVSLVDPDPRWTVVAPGDGFEEGRTYNVRAWPAPDATLGAVEFTLGDLAAIGGGEVRFFDGEERIAPVDEFLEVGRDRCV